jgi:ferric-dicitrate binding protein FerR (iron transport regulator)
MTRPDHEIDAYLEGTLTEAQARAIDAWVNADPANAAEFLHLVQTHQMLVVVGKEQRVAREAENASHEDLDPVTLHTLAQMEASADPVPFNELDTAFTFENESERKAQKSADLANTVDDLRWALGKATTRLVRSTPFITGSIAAVLLIGLLLLAPWNKTTPTSNPDMPAASTQSTPRGSEPLATHTAVATLTATHNAIWAEGASAPGSPLRPGDALAAGQRLNLTAGYAEITTNDGAVAILEAPATIELLSSDNALHLKQGKLVGLCHTDSSKGLVVKTDYAVITDLGTEFGVQVQGNQVTTTVFTGEVVVSTPGAEPVNLTANQTARLTVNGINREVVVEDDLAKGFAKRLPRQPLVTAARINLPGYEAEIMPQAVWEDVVRVTDDVHELNGLDALGLPVELLGGDLIRMPIAARMDANASSLTLELDFAKPADVYLVLLDDEPEHDWLLREYERTTLRIGLDQGKKNRPGFTAVGPGESIDYTANVWKRKQPASGTTIVARDTSLSTYSIIVQPANQERPN